MIKSKSYIKQIPIDYSFVISKTYKSFIIGNNQELVKSLKSLKISTKKNIIFIYGKRSSGKTHLLKATETYFNSNVLYVDEKKETNFDLNKLSKYNLLLIDNLEKIISTNEKEKNIFKIINEFILNKKNIVVSSNKPLKKINFSLPDLSSRLAWDLQFEIYDLNDADKIKVLKKYASERGLTLSPKVCSYIISHLQRDIFYLCNSVKFFDKNSLSLRKRITIPFIKKIIEYKN